MNYKLFIACTAIIVLILIAAREGVVLHYIEEMVTGVSTKLSKIWHALGAWIRGVVVIVPLVVYIPNWLFIAWLGSVLLWFAWVGYDGISNLLNHVPYNKWYKKFFYSGSRKTGTGSQLSIWLSENNVLDFIKAIYTILVIAFTIFYFTF